MIVYDNILPEDFYKKLTNIEGKFALDETNGNYYRFTYPAPKVAIDFENLFLGVGIPHQCDVAYFSKRSEGVKTVYKQYKDIGYSVLIYFINENYEGGELLYNSESIEPKANKAVYFDSGIDLDLALVTSGTQYLYISYFRKSPVKSLKTII